MKTAVAAIVVLGVNLGGAAYAQEKEKRIQSKDLPPAVQEALKEHSKGATVVGYAREVEAGVTPYEAEMKVGNRTKDVTFDPNGNLLSVEEETTLDSIPAPARDAIRKVVGKRKLLLVETVSEKGATFYEAHYKSGLRTKEVKVDAAGNTVK